MRIEDLDTARVIPGKADEILQTLEQHGLEWDGPVAYQSERIDLYQAAFGALSEQNSLFACACTRRMLRSEEEGGPAYPGTCRSRNLPFDTNAVRFIIDDDAQIGWDDEFLGRHTFDLKSLGDFVVRRRDGGFAYHLAVVVDDAAQGITSVIRGSDLLESTPWQIALQRALAFPTPTYGHAPLLTEPNGDKLSKSRRSVALDHHAVSDQLMLALRVLGQDPPPSLVGASAAEILEWAIAHWQTAPLRQRKSVSLKENFVTAQSLY